MSTPLFIRAPKAGAKNNASSGSSYTLFSAVAEATLIEEVRITSSTAHTNASLLYVYLHDPDAGADIVAQLVEIPASGVGVFAYVAAAVNVCIPVGWSLKALHTLADGGGGVAADIIALGGIVR